MRYPVAEKLEIIKLVEQSHPDTSGAEVLDPSREPVDHRRLCVRMPSCCPSGVETAHTCESASNLDPTPIVRQIVEEEAELFISEVFDRRPIVTPSFSRKSFDCNRVTAVFAKVQVGRRFTPGS
jgi:hypothetical protein